MEVVSSGGQAELLGVRGGFGQELFSGQCAPGRQSLAQNGGGRVREVLVIGPDGLLYLPEGGLDQYGAVLFGGLQSPLAQVSTHSHYLWFTAAKAFAKTSS